MAGLLTYPVLPLAAQRTDVGTLVVRYQGRDIGLESFHRLVRAEGGDSVGLTSSYPGVRPVVQWVAALDRRDPKAPTFQLARRQQGVSVLWYAAVNRTRLVVRRVDREGEQAREYPAPGGIVILADSAFALYAQIASLADSGRRSLAAVFPASGLQVSFVAECVPAKRMSGAARSGMLCRATGGLTAEVELGPEGRLRRVSLPAAGLEAVRQEE
jgi:hypothetical protein